MLSALEQFRSARTHFAFVVDEFGSVEGVVTLSDVMETIAGDLPNEAEDVDARHDIQHQAPNVWVVNGHMPLADLLHWVTFPLEEKRSYHTVAGLLMDHLQHIPAPGEGLRIGNVRFTTLEVDNHRIQRVEVCDETPSLDPDYEV